MAKSQGKNVPKPKDPLEKVIRPIVEGQLKAYADAHPELLTAVNWYKPRPDKLETFINSGAKRICRDLLSGENRARLVLAVKELSSKPVAIEEDGQL